jgi:maleate isomerase
MTSTTKNAIPFESVSESPVFDDGPGKFRIGLIALSNDYVTERDFINMRPSDDVAIYTSRLLNTPQCTVETLREMTPGITEAAALLVPEGRLDVVAYSCTSGPAVMGFERIRSLIQAARPGVACVTPLTSSLQALDLFGASRIAVLAPYVDDVNASISGYIGTHGKTISAFTSFRLAENEDMAKLSPASIYSAALEADRHDADALFISCTAIRAVEVIDRIEQKLGKPVISAVQAMFWQALRLSGFSGKVTGFGHLLSHY